MVQYVNGYNESGIVDDRFNRHQRREQKREYEKRRQEILHRYLERHSSQEGGQEEGDGGEEETKEDGEGKGTEEVNDLVFRDELPVSKKARKGAGIEAYIEKMKQIEIEKQRQKGPLEVIEIEDL